jgi:hypothetical protein
MSVLSLFSSFLLFFSFPLSHFSCMCFFFQGFLLYCTDKPVNSMSFYSHTFPLLMWPFSTFSGHGFPFAGASRQLSFHEVRMSVVRPTPNPEGVWPGTQNLSGWVALKVPSLPPAMLSSSRMHARSLTWAIKPSTTRRYDRDSRIYDLRLMALKVLFATNS